jgi:hypothetical protein
VVLSFFASGQPASGWLSDVKVSSGFIPAKKINQK